MDTLEKFAELIGESYRGDDKWVAIMDDETAGTLDTDPAYRNKKITWLGRGFTDFTFAVNIKYTELTNSRTKKEGKETLLDFCADVNDALNYAGVSIHIFDKDSNPPTHLAPYGTPVLTVVKCFPSEYIDSWSGKAIFDVDWLPKVGYWIIRKLLYHANFGTNIDTITEAMEKLNNVCSKYNLVSDA